MSSTPVGGRSDRPSPATLAAATAQQAADVMPRETALQDGVLLVLSYEGDNIFVLSNSSYEHVLDSALAHFTLRNVDRTRIRLALQTTIGTSETLVYITPDTWPAVASRAKVITVLVQPPPSTPSQSSPNPPAKPTPSATHRVASPVRESEPTSWPGSPRPSTSWHPAYPASVAYPLPAPPASSPTRGTAPRSLAHSRQHSQSAATASASAPHYPYAHMHYFPAPPSAVSPTTDLSFIGVRPLTEAELKQERPSHAVPAKRHWEQAEHAASDERASYPRPPPETSGGSESARSRELAGSSQPDESRKPKRVSLNALRVQTSRLTPTPGAGMEPARPPVLVQALPANRLAGLEKGAFADLHSSASHVAIRHAYSAADGPDGPKTLCNACGLSYAKELARREAAASAATQQQALSPPERSTGYGHSSGAPASRSTRAVGTKTFDGSDAIPEGSFSGPSASAAPAPPAAPRECSTCKRTDSPQWRKGPDGPNTLCNSCGLAWARQRKEGTHSRPGSSRSPSPTAVPPTYHQATPLPRSPNGRLRSPSAGSHPASPTHADESGAP